MDVIEHELTIIRNFAKLITKSDPYNRAFGDIQKELNIEDTNIQRDCSTRWSSTLKMIKDFLRKKPAIEMFHVKMEIVSFQEKYGLKEKDKV